MIFVDRNSVPDPFDQNARLGQIAIKENRSYEDWMRSGQSKQKRFSFRAYVNKDVKEALGALFHDKCAYCESIIASTAPMDVEQFRPKSSVMEAPNHPGYWWLANSWDNLLSSCIDCNRTRRQRMSKSKTSSASVSGKGNRFPLVDENFRAYEPGAELDEQPLLLDPTKDHPEQHFVYEEDGRLFSHTERGNTTISVLGLNRSGLVAARKNTLDSFNLLLESYETSTDEQHRLKLAAAIKSALSDAAPYLGIIRQRSSNENLSLEAYNDFDPAHVATSGAAIQKAKRSSKAFEEKLSDYTLESEDGIKTYKTVSRSIESISLKNIRAIKQLDIKFENMSGGITPWLMLLGENGTGKSTVLQAIALTLSGSDYVQNLIKAERFDLTRIVRHRCKTGSIKIKISGFTKPFKMTVFNDHLELSSPTGNTTWISKDGDVTGGWTPPTIIMAYGATRLLPRKKHGNIGTRFARIDNLFDPFVPLENAKDWLLSQTERKFNDSAMILKDLLNLDEDAFVLKQNQEIYVKTKGTKILLKDLSDGYQTIVAVTIDILAVLSNLWDNLLEAEGIVLIDELDAHLHPTWQMQIVSSLREAFKGVQFITSTHQPLCLRGLNAGEVAVMQRDENSLVTVETDLPSPGDFRVDQLLTSEFFGLNSTIDPETEILFDQYYALLAMPERTPKQETQLKDLTSQLKDRRHLGDTQRESLYYEAVDKLLAENKSVKELSSSEINEKAVTQISNIWDSMIKSAETSTGGS